MCVYLYNSYMYLLISVVDQIAYKQNDNCENVDFDTHEKNVLEAVYMKRVTQYSELKIAYNEKLTKLTRFSTFRLAGHLT